MLYFDYIQPFLSGCPTVFREPVVEQSLDSMCFRARIVRVRDKANKSTWSYILDQTLTDRQRTSWDTYYEGRQFLVDR